MAAPELDRPGQELIPAPISESAARSVPGVVVLVIGIAALAAGLGIATRAIGSASGGAQGALVLADIVIFILAWVALGGLTTVSPGEGRVVQLFGNYRGTLRKPGLHWVNPLAQRRRVSVRIGNHETPVAKVNDADGNPVEIAAVVVWQVTDTARALYAVNDYPKFIATQAETAVRHIASSYPYTSQDAQLSLRENAEEVTGQLSAEIAARVAPAGVQVIESRLTRLSYAAEIAQAMLRQQQASAVVGARRRIVEGAVGMVQLALTRLESEGVVELDEERKAAMVSNLLVVLCSEQATQQVVNTGSLYQ